MGEEERLRVAIYCRLSKEDREKQSESESIHNQKELLLRHALEQHWDVVDIYCDEDYSGADRERPAFCRLLSEAESGRFDIVLVKTQSRFTRDMELVERYLHGLFPEWGLRFVALLDHIDTALQGNKKARQINGLVNEWYLEDLSENIRAVFDHKRRAGQYIGSFPLYGYQKDPYDKNKLQIDPEAALVVQRIFRLCLAGEGKQRIAALLNAEGLPNPTAYKQQKGLAYVNAGQRGREGLWSRTTVGRILREQMYTGDLVQGRRKKAGYKSKRLINVPPEDWVIVPDQHEAIISREDFAAVQRLLDGRSKSDGSGIQHPLSGKVRCLDCGSTMVKVTNTYQSVRRSYLRCKRHTQGVTLCSSHSIRLDRLEQAVLTSLREHLASVSEPERLLSQVPREQTAQESQRRELLRMEGELTRREQALRELYLDKAGGLVSDIQFHRFQEAYQQEMESLQARATLLAERCAEQDAQEEAEAKRRRVLACCCAPEQLNRELCALFVDCVEVGETENGKQEVCIHWLF